MKVSSYRHLHDIKRYPTGCGDEHYGGVDCVRLINNPSNRHVKQHPRQNPQEQNGQQRAQNF